MSFSLTWLPKILKEADLKVATVDGWETRGHDDVGEIVGVICHHTAGPATGNMPSLRVVTNGRADLPGPLAQLCLGRDGTYYVVAAGKCYHAGKGAWQGYKTGNTSFIGIEAENMGTHKDPWPEVQMDAYRRGVSAILKHIGQAPIMCAGHKEYAPGRKPDPLFDMDPFRAGIAAIMKGTAPAPALIPQVEPKSPREDVPTPRSTLRRGSTGELVKQVQEKVGVAADGDFGSKTEAAVRVFQRTHDMVPDGIVGPKTWAALDGKSGMPQSTDSGIARSQSTENLRRLWHEYECAEHKTVLIPFGPDKIRVAPPTASAWEALAAVLEHHGYKIRTTETDSYNCRTMKGSDRKSLHSFGIAIDINCKTNPFNDHDGSRSPRFSDKETQDERADDVRLARADTDMTQRMIKDVLAIRTRNGKPVFEWGGNWLTVKEAMHFEISVAPDDLDAGIDTTTVVGWDDHVDEDADSTFMVSTDNTAATAIHLGVPHRIDTPSGLRLRSGPGSGFAVIRTVSNGEVVHVLSTAGSWVQVDLQGDGLADGYMLDKYLSAVTPISQPTANGSGIFDKVTVEQVAKIFPVTGKANIAANLPFVLDGLRGCGLTDRGMLLMALATIRAETEGFLPISEGISKYNTSITPFDKYDMGTSKGVSLGNTKAGDGPHFKGRGYVQLTGRFNYKEIGKQIDVDLVGNPDLANDPGIAGLILAQFLKNRETGIRSALADDNFKEARRLVNGGSHGFDRFKDAYDRGLTALA
jgi:hypothetical protein